MHNTINRLKKTRIDKGSLLLGLAAVFYLGIVSYFGYTGIKKALIYKKVTDSPCLSKHLQSEYTSSDITLCLCEEGGGISHQEVLTDGVFMNICVYNATEAHIDPRNMEIRNDRSFY